MNQQNNTTIIRYTMDPSPEQLAKFLKTHYPDGIYHSVYEAGFCGYWIHRRLLELGIDNIVVNAADPALTQAYARLLCYVASSYRKSSIFFVSENLFPNCRW